VIRSRAPWDVFYEPTLEDFDDHMWRVDRDRGNKWDLCARYPEHREKLLAMDSSDEFAIEAFFGFDAESVNTDELVVKHFYHAKTRALPTGRYIMYVGDIVLFDDSLPYDGDSFADQLPFVDYCPAEFIGTALGYADSWDLIPLNQMLDQVLSDTATNVANLGRATLVGEEGMDFDLDALAAGMRMLTIPPGAQMPQYMQPPPLGEGAQFIFGLLNEKFASISGLNPTARGQSTSNVTSGEMAALFHSIAVEVNSGRQMAVDSHRERVANKILQVTQKFAEHPIMLTITGADSRQYSKEVSPAVFKGVHQVVMKTANPMNRTAAGRLQKVQIMKEFPGAIETPSQIDTMLMTGALEPLYKAPMAKTMRIAWENEQLRQGPPVQQSQDPMTGEVLETVPACPVLVEDPHEMHVPEHYAELCKPELLMNDAARKAILAHMREHRRIWATQLDAGYAALLKIAPPPNLGAELVDDEQAEQQSEGGKPAGGSPKAENGRAMDSTGVAIPEPSKPPKGAQTQPPV